MELLIIIILIHFLIVLGYIIKDNLTMVNLMVMEYLHLIMIKNCMGNL